MGEALRFRSLGAFFIGGAEMIVVMRPGCEEGQIQHVRELIEELGLKAIILRGTNRTVIAAIGDKRETDKEFLRAAPGVENVVPILAPYKVASLEVKPEPTVVDIGSAKVGGKALCIVAGPCAVESREQILEVARAVKRTGGHAIRGGAFKPRTSPYSFQGLAEEGLRFLAEARQITGLSVVTEVMSVETVDLVGKYADVFQIGARNMQNFHLLQAVGQFGKPVLLKRGMSATLDELLFAAEYILSSGTQDVILCERGIRTFENHTRNTLSLSVIPALKERTHLPIIVDPSHGTGRHEYVIPMSRAAVAAGADGLLVEVHPNPEKALSDGAQSLNFKTFEQLIRDITPIAQALGRTLQPL